MSEESVYDKARMAIEDYRNDVFHRTNNSRLYLLMSEKTHKALVKEIVLLLPATVKECQEVVTMSFMGFVILTHSNKEDDGVRVLVDWGRWE